MNTFEPIAPLGDPYLSILEASKYVARHPQTLRLAAKNGELEFIQRGARGHYKFRVSALDAWMQIDTVPATK